MCVCVLILILLLRSFRSCLLRTRVRPLTNAADAVPAVVMDAELRTAVLSLRNCHRLYLGSKCYLVVSSMGYFVSSITFLFSLSILLLMPK